MGALGNWLNDTFSIGATPGASDNPEVNNSPFSDAGVLQNYADAEAWDQYLKVLNASNEFNSSQATLAFERQKELRDTQVSSYMKQLKDNGINPILAVNSGYSGATAPSVSSAQAYTGTSPASHSAQVDTAVINSIASLIILAIELMTAVST